MTNPVSLSMGLALLSAAVLGLALNGCGMNSMTQNRMLESMSVSPAIANAATSPGGKVQFKATGTFSQPPTPDVVTFVAPYSGSWSVSNLDIATISPSGLAQCVAGASGTVDVTAIASANSTTMPGAMSVAVTAKAKLTCP
jgi:hypothetical protein